MVVDGGNTTSKGLEIPGRVSEGTVRFKTGVGPTGVVICVLSGWGLWDRSAERLEIEDSWSW